MENLGSTPTKSASDYTSKEVIEQANKLNDEIKSQLCIVIMVQDGDLHVMNNVGTLGEMMNILTGVASGILESTEEGSDGGRSLQ